MGRFSDMKDKLANARDTVHIKVLEAQLEREERKKKQFEQNKQDFLAKLAKYLGPNQPMTVFEEGKWYQMYADGRKVPIALGAETPAQPDQKQV